MSIIILEGAEERRQGIYYEVDTDSAPLGAGGMGQVYRGVRVERATNRRVPAAIKFLFEDLSDKAVERSRREAQIHLHNDNLVEMFGFIETAGPGGEKHFHVASELLEGVMLLDFLQGSVCDRQGEPIAFAEKLYEEYLHNRTAFAGKVVKNVLSGVMALHDKGYIHRDIDPSNIMLTVDGKIKLIDFGIAKQLTNLNTQDQHLTSTGQFMGKAAYASPELIVGDVPHQNETTDIYAVGILLFQLLTGHLPFTGPDHEVLDMQMHKELPLKDIADKSLRRIVGKATKKKQSERYQSAAEFRVALEQSARTSHSRTDVKVNVGKGGGTPGDGFLSRLWATRRPAVIGAAAAVCLLGAGIAVIASSSSEDQGGEVTAETRPEGLPASGLVIDDKADRTVSYEGDDYASVGHILNQWEPLLSDSVHVQEAIAHIQEAVDAGYTSSAQAAYTLSRMYAHDLPGQAVPAVDRNDVKAFEYLSMACRLDSAHPRALYEMGEAYLAGESYTGGLVQRDLGKALEYYRKSQRHAQAANDQTLLNKVEIRIQELEGYLAPQAIGGEAPAEMFD